VDQPRLGPGGGGHLLEDLVPGQQFVGGDVEQVANGRWLPQQPHKPFGKVAVMGERPQRGAIAMHHHLFALAHPVDDGVAAVAWAAGFGRRCATAVPPSSGSHLAR
jgi:hypothetical protein